MKSDVRWKPALIGGAAALVMALGVAAVYPQVSMAQSTTPATPAPTEKADKGATNTPAEKTGKGARGADVDHNAQLAEALGITTDELDAAYKKAAGAALDQAVKDELLTQKQADALKERLDAADGGMIGRGFGRMGGAHFAGGSIDFQALLADALGIKVADLQAAEQKARGAEIDQQVTDGNLTQDQADLEKAWLAFREYQRAQQPTVEEQLKAAVAAGAITQDQADLLLKAQENGGGMWGRGMQGGDMGPGMRGGRGERGMGHGDMDHGMNGMPGMGRGDMGQDMNGMPGMNDQDQNGQGMNGMPGMNGQNQNGQGMNGQFRGHHGHGNQQQGGNGNQNPNWGQPNDQQNDQSQGNSGLLVPTVNF